MRSVWEPRRNKALLLLGMLPLSLKKQGPEEKMAQGII